MAHLQRASALDVNSPDISTNTGRQTNGMVEYVPRRELEGINQYDEMRTRTDVAALIQHYEDDKRRSHQALASERQYRIKTESRHDRIGAIAQRSTLRRDRFNADNLAMFERIIAAERQERSAADASARTDRLAA